MHTCWIHTACTLFILYFLLSSVPAHGLFSSIFSGNKDKDEQKGGVGALSEEKFDEIIKKNEDVLVVLFQLPGEVAVNPYSGTKCMLETARQALRYRRVIFGMVDTKPLARREGATEAGVIHIYKSGQKVIYKGQPSGQTLAAFVSKMLQPAISKFDDDDEDEVDDLAELLDDLKEVDFPIAIGYFKHNSTEHQKFQEVAVRWQAFIRFYAVFNSESAEQLGMKTQGSVYLYQPFRKRPALLNLVKVTNDKDIDAFINKNKHYVLHKLSPSETQQLLTAKKGSTQIFTFLDTDRSDGRAFFTIFRRVVKQLSKGVWHINPIVWIEPDEFSMLMEDIKNQYDINWKIPVIGVISGDNTKGTWLDMSVLTKLPCEAARYMALYSWVEAAASGAYSNKYRNTGLVTQPLPQSQMDFLCTFPFEADDWEEEEKDTETITQPYDGDMDKKKLRETEDDDEDEKIRMAMDHTKDYEIETSAANEDDDDDFYDSWTEKDGGTKKLKSQGHSGGDDPDYPSDGDNDDGGRNDPGDLRDPDEHHMGTLFVGQPEDDDQDNDDDNAEENQNEDGIEQAENDENEHTQSQDQDEQPVDREDGREQTENKDDNILFDDDEEDTFVHLLPEDDKREKINLEENTRTTESQVKEEKKDSIAQTDKQPSKSDKKKQKKGGSSLFDDDDDDDSVQILPDDDQIDDLWSHFESKVSTDPVKENNVIDNAEAIHDQVEKAGMGEAMEDDDRQEKETVTQKKKVQKQDVERKKEEKEDNLSWDFIKEAEEERSTQNNIKEDASEDLISGTKQEADNSKKLKDQLDPFPDEPVITVSDDYDLNATEEKKVAKKSVKFRPAPVYKFPNQPNYESEDMFEILCGNFLDGELYPECGKKQRRKALQEALRNSKIDKTEK